MLFVMLANLAVLTMPNCNNEASTTIDVTKQTQLTAIYQVAMTYLPLDQQDSLNSNNAQWQQQIGRCSVEDQSYYIEKRLKELSLIWRDEIINQTNYPTYVELNTSCEQLASLATAQQLSSLQVAPLTEDELNILTQTGQWLPSSKSNTTPYLYKQQAVVLNSLVDNKDATSISLNYVYPVYLQAKQKPKLFFDWSFLVRGGYNQITLLNNLMNVNEITIEQIDDRSNDSNTIDTLVFFGNRYYILNSDEDDVNLLIEASWISPQGKRLPVCHFAAKYPISRHLIEAKIPVCKEIQEGKYSPINSLSAAEIAQLKLPNDNNFYYSKAFYLIDLFDTGEKNYISVGYQWWNSFRGDNAPVIKLVNSNREFEDIGIGDDMGDIGLSPRRDLDTSYKIYNINDHYYIDTYYQIITYYQGKQEAVCTFDQVNQTATKVVKVLATDNVSQ